MDVWAGYVRDGHTLFTWLHSAACSKKRRKFGRVCKYSKSFAPTASKDTIMTRFGICFIALLHPAAFALS